MSFIVSFKLFFSKVKFGIGNFIEKLLFIKKLFQIITFLLVFGNIFRFVKKKVIEIQLK